MTGVDSKPENPLEKALVAAATDPARRPDFYRAFLSAQIYLIDERPGLQPEGSVVLAQDTELKLRSIDFEGAPHLPVFSSITRLQKFVQRESRYLAMRCSDFLPVIKGSAVLLNPASDFGKQFAPAEIAALLDGSIFAPQSSRVTTQPEEVFLGQPAEYPTHVTDALAKYFRRRGDVRAAYLAHFSNPATGDPPHTLIGVDTTGPWKEIAGEAGIVLGGVCRPDELVDLMQIDKSGVSDYLRRTKPFYKKKILGLF
jgi:hypothetical protein